MNHSIIPLLLTLAVSITLKLLLIPAYRSTDFDVHQNWMRITYNTQLQQWYYDNNNKWTLDYPPLFAYFQYLLSHIAGMIDVNIVKPSILFAQSTVIFQRVSVIVSQSIYILVLWRYLGMCNRFIVCAFFIPLIMLDNIHFQYNTMLQGIFLLSIIAMQNQQYLKGAFWFALLLNFKHIYLYSAPVFFVFLLRWYVFRNNQFNLIMFGKLALVTIIPFIMSFGPFLCIGGIQQLKQILSRLFPFQRGLVHQYWAPNFWGIYMTVDKILVKILSKLYIIQPTSQSINPNILKILPDIPPIITILIILCCISPLLLFIWKSKEQPKFTSLVAVCGITFFMFGFHVHQKAITPYINILMVNNLMSNMINMGIYVNIINLIPLILGSQMITSNLLFVLIWIIYCNGQLTNTIKNKIITYSGILIILYHQFKSLFISNDKLPFLSILINSTWAAVFNIYFLLVLYYETVKVNKMIQPI